MDTGSEPALHSVLLHIPEAEKGGDPPCPRCNLESRNLSRCHPP